MADNELTAAERALVELREAYYVVFTQDAEGRRVWADLQASGFVWRTTVATDADGRIDMAATLRNEGARAFVLAIRAQMEKAVVGYQPRQREATPSVGRE